MEDKPVKRARNEMERLLKKVEEINDMKYPKSRKTRAEELRKDLKKIDLICGAIDKTGKICMEEPPEESQNGRCARHGGLATGPITDEGMQKALSKLDPRARIVAGLYTQFIMTPEEMEFYGSLMNYYVEEYDLDPMNVMALDRALRNFLLNQRKERAIAGEIIDESESYNDYDMKFMKYMQTLGFDRKFNVSKDHKDNSKNDIAMLFMDGEE